MDILGDEITAVNDTLQLLRIFTLNSNQNNMTNGTLYEYRLDSTVLMELRCGNQKEDRGSSRC